MRENAPQKNKILFISHEMSYTGAPRSLLRMCRVARRMGYVPTVWTMRSGPLEAAFAAEGIPVRIGEKCYGKYNRKRSEIR